MASGIPTARSAAADDSGNAPATKVVDESTPGDKVSQPASPPWTFDPINPSKKPPIDINYHPPHDAQSLPTSVDGPPQKTPTAGVGQTDQGTVPQPEQPHKDQAVGQGKMVDPHDKVVTTPPIPLDPDALRKLIKDPLKPIKEAVGHADPGKPAENFGGPPPGSTPPGPGYTWNPISQSWQKSADGDKCPVTPQP